MLQLSINFPEIHQEFMRGKFAAQLRDNSGLSPVESDKVIEMILNKDAKGSGGCTCFSFSTNVNAIKRREINATYRALLRSRFHKHINYQLQKYKHPDLNPS